MPSVARGGIPFPTPPPPTVRRTTRRWTRTRGYSWLMPTSHHVAADVGQAEVAALVADGQFLVVDAQQAQHGRVQVVDLDDVLDGVVAQLVGGAVGGPGLDAAAGQPHRKALHVMVAAVALGH